MLEKAMGLEECQDQLGQVVPAMDSWACRLLEVIEDELDAGDIRFDDGMV
jgi:hypothetical protein